MQVIARNTKRPFTSINPEPCRKWSLKQNRCEQNAGPRAEVEHTELRIMLGKGRKRSFHEHFGFGARHQRVRVKLERAAPKLLGAHNPRNRFACQAAFNKPIEASLLFLGYGRT